MKNPLKNPLFRMTYYEYCFKLGTIGAEGEKSITEIAGLMEAYELPVSQIRKDMISMLDLKMILPSEDGRFSDGSKHKMTDDFKRWLEFPSDREFFSLISAGEYDSLVFEWNNLQNSQNAGFQMLLSEYEYAAFSKYIRNGVDYHLASLGVKDSFRSKNANKTLEVLSVIDNAIGQNNDVSMRVLKGERGITVPETITPKKIVYDATENAYAVATINTQGDIKLYRIDDITEVEEKQSSENRKLEKLQRLWGLDYKKNEKETAVCVKFYDEANVHNKVRRDVDYRHEHLREEDGFLIYEDHILGYETFKEWVLGFGASAIVVKPGKLRDEIIRAFTESVQAEEENA